MTKEEKRIVQYCFNQGWVITEMHMELVEIKGDKLVFKPTYETNWGPSERIVPFEKITFNSLTFMTCVSPTEARKLALAALVST